MNPLPEKYSNTSNLSTERRNEKEGGREQDMTMPKIEEQYDKMGLF